MKAYCISLKNRIDRRIEFRKNQFPFQVQFHLVDRHPTNGWIGNRNSHAQLLARSKPSDFPVLIMEDDCEVIEPWEVVEEAMRELPKDWDMLYLGASMKGKLTKYSEHLYKLKKGWTTHAIIYSEKVAQYILNHYIAWEKLDEFYVKELQEKFNCYMVRPMAATQSDSDSDIKKGRKNRGRIMDRYKSNEE